MTRKNKVRLTQKVYEIVAQIPKGRVSAYGNIAKALKTKAYRAVGNAMNKNPYVPDVPCHRVIKSNGEVGGFASGTKKKIQMLKKEGISITGGKINLKKYLYRFR